MKNSTKIFGVLGLLAVLLVSAGIGFAGDSTASKTGSTTDWADSGPRMHMQKERMEEVSPEVREQLHEAVEAGDYDLWSQIREENGLPEDGFITEENIGLLAEMHTAMQSGDFETATQLSEELGLEKGFGKGFRKGPGPRHGFENRFENMSQEEQGEFCNMHCACDGE